MAMLSKNDAPKHAPKHAAPKGSKKVIENTTKVAKDAKPKKRHAAETVTTAKPVVPVVPAATVADVAPAPKRKRHLWVIPVVAAGILGAAYLGGVAYFSNTFLPGTTVDGTSVSLKSTEALAALKSSTYDDYEIRVQGEGLDTTVRAADIDLAFDGSGYAARAMASIDPWAWPLEISSTRALTVGPVVTYDHDKLVQVIQTAIDAADAAADEAGKTSIAFDATTGQYTASSAALTEHLDAGLVADTVATHFATLDEVAEVGADCVTGESDVRAALNQANTYVASTIDVTLGGEHVTDVTAEQIAGWVKIGDDLSVSLDTAAIEDWCHGELSDMTDSYQTERTYTRPDNVEETVTGGRGVYGWIIDGTTAATQIEEALATGQPSTLDLPTKKQAETYNPGGQDWGDRYIDVDISDQHAVFFDGGQVIWEADVVTGLPAENRDTPQGVWTITEKRTDANLKGPVDPETNEPEWDSHVDFWMGIVGTAVGFHNAPWRSAFGGTIYQWNGSHGCINLSYEKGEALYNLCKVGDVVVVHE